MKTILKWRRAPANGITEAPRELTEIYRPAIQPASIVSRSILGACDAAQVFCSTVKTTICLSSLTLASPCLLLPSQAPFSSSIQTLYWRGLSNTVASIGPTAVKFLQWASTRRDLFPDPLCNQVMRYKSQSHNQFSNSHISHAQEATQPSQA